MCTLTARELQTCTFEAPGSSKTPLKFNERTPQEREERKKIVAGEGKKERNFGRSGGGGSRGEGSRGELARDWPQWSWPKQTHSSGVWGLGFWCLGFRFLGFRFLGFGVWGLGF